MRGIGGYWGLMARLFSIGGGGEIFFDWGRREHDGGERKKKKWAGM